MNDSVIQMRFPYGTSSGHSVHLYPWLHRVFLEFSDIQYYTKINKKNWFKSNKIMYLIQDKLKIILIFISYKFTSGVHGKQNKNTIYYKNWQQYYDNLLQVVN